MSLLEATRRKAGYKTRKEFARAAGVCAHKLSLVERGELPLRNRSSIAAAYRKLLDLTPHQVRAMRASVIALLLLAVSSGAARAQTAWVPYCTQVCETEPVVVFNNQLTCYTVFHVPAPIPSPWVQILSDLLASGRLAKRDVEPVTFLRNALINYNNNYEPHP